MMKRRTFLHAGLGTIATGAAISAGYMGASTTSVSCEPPLPQNRPQAVYYPSHTEGMRLIGINQPKEGSKTLIRPRYKCALMYSYPHRFWTVMGDKREKVEVRKDDTIHLMASIWDTQSAAPLPNANPSVNISKQDEKGETITLWPMLSQNMGFHAGDNVSLSGEGQYSITVDIAPSIKDATVPHKPSSNSIQRFEFEFVYEKQRLSEISSTGPRPESIQPGAASPMEMNRVPIAYAPDKQSLPGRFIHELTMGDAIFLISILRENKSSGNGGTYLMVSPRTPYNRYVLPSMSLTGRGMRGKNVLFDKSLSARVLPDLNYHYGARVERIIAGDTIEITIDTPPQVARHEGYETAFFNMRSKRFTV